MIQLLVRTTDPAPEEGAMTIPGQIARIFDELFEAVDSLVAVFFPPREENSMSTEPTSGDSQELDPQLLANIAIKKVKKNDYCGFGRNLTDRILKQFIEAQAEGRVTWENGTGCFKLDMEICITPEDPPATQLLSMMGAQGKCLRVCVDGECVYIC